MQGVDIEEQNKEKEPQLRHEDGQVGERNGLVLSVAGHELVANGGMVQSE